MCGLFFVLQRGHPVDRERFRTALNCSAHRGPDHQGIAFQTLPAGKGQPELHAAFGHNRLSILDLDPRSHQPFERGEQTLLYNGEVYNFEALRPELADQTSDPFLTRGDTEVLAAMLAADAERWLPRANGMFAFCSLFSGQGHVLAGRDRYGKKPLFFWQDEHTICLSSSVASIAAYLGRSFNFRTDVLRDYLVHGNLFPSTDGTTHFEEIRLVRPGHLLRFEIETWRWTEKPLAYPERDHREVDLAEDLRDACRLRLVSDRRVGLLLSGGVDSTVVLSALTQQKLIDQVTCFVGETGRSEDAAWGLKAAQAAGVQAEVIELDYGSETFQRFLRMCAHHEKPFALTGNAMAMPAMYEAIAAQDIPVVIDGTGGDEIFGGYWDRYWPYALRDAWQKGDYAWLRESLRANRGIASTLLRKTMKQRLKGLRSRSAGALAMDGFLKFSPADTRPIDPLDGFVGTLVEAQTLDAFHGRLGDWIWQNDRNAMMHGIENRSPLLDERLSANIARPVQDKFNGVWNKYALRRSFDDLLPLPTQWRQQKQGFRWASRRFLSENRSDIIELIRDAPALQDHVDTAAFAEAANGNDRLMRGALVGRLMGIAGVGEALSIR